ncbi:protein extra-macrochaetae [Drosophila tropicalis]|uniref:protein extra-macrochaetae n=1 Tax=Drosophila tropicalis TaxID=46794 RepID=UPI0035ABB7AE
MKSLTAVCQTGASGMPAINPNGRIARHPPHRGDGENAEMKMYLSKLKDLVPFMPKNRKLSKLEIIQHVIDYICDLQTELETHPEINNFDAAAALSSVAHAAAAAEDDDDDDDMMNLTEADNSNDMLAQRLAAEQQLQLQQQQEQQQQLTKISSPAARMPLIDRQSPNTIVKVSSSSTTSVSSLTTSSVVTASAPMQQQLLPSQPQLANSLTTHLNAEKDSRQS